MEAAHFITFHFNDDAAQKWLTCKRAGRAEPVCERESATTLGGNLAAGAFEGAAMAGPIERPPSPDVVSGLVGLLKQADLPTIIDEVSHYVPEVKTKEVYVFLVANGDPLGDGYVRRVQGNATALRLADNGAPAVFLNPVLLAKSKKTPQETAASVLRLVRHELFHVLFGDYVDSSSTWQGIKPSPISELATVLVNEGIAHFADRRPLLEREGFPMERVPPVFQRLGIVLNELASLPASSSEARKLVESSNYGSYWDKFGSISGMFIAWAIHRELGDAGLRESVQCGPGRMVKLYERARVARADLPTLPSSVEQMRTNLDVCR